MSTVNDLDDLLNIIRQHPAWHRQIADQINTPPAEESPLAQAPQNNDQDAVFWMLVAGATTIGVMLAILFGIAACILFLAGYYLTAAIWGAGAIASLIIIPSIPWAGLLLQRKLYGSSTENDAR